MKIFKNIVPVMKLHHSLKYLKEFKKEILKAREAGDFEKEREYILKSTDFWGNHLVKIFDIQLHVTGKENLPESGPVVFAANHQGYADIPITCAALNKFQFAFVARDNLERIPLYGAWIKQIRSVYIKREDARASLRAIDEGIDLLEKGFSLLIFPEGTRSKSGSVSEFKKGSLRLATKPGVPVIPVTINGTFRIFEENGYIKKGARVDIMIHPVIETKGMDKSTCNNLSSEVEKIVKEGLEKIKKRGGSMTLEITKDNFETEVLNSDIPVLVDFWASWCGPCLMAAPVIEDLSRELSGKVKVGKINVDENFEIAAKYGADSIPMFVVFENGKVAATAVGAMNKEALKRELNL